MPPAIGLPLIFNNDGKFANTYSEVIYRESHLACPAPLDSTTILIFWYKTYEVQLRSRFYASTDLRPSALQVETRASIDRDVPRFPLAEGHFSGANVQPYIHNCSVIVLEGLLVHHFTVFFKNHCHLPLNRFLMDSGNGFRGDLLVMRAAARNYKSFVNMRGRDFALADYAAKRFALKHLPLSCLLTLNEKVSART